MLKNTISERRENHDERQRKFEAFKQQLIDENERKYGKEIRENTAMSK